MEVVHPRCCGIDVHQASLARKLSTTGQLRLMRHSLSGLRIADCTSKMHICDRAFTPQKGTMKRVKADRRAEIYQLASYNPSWRLSA